MTPRDLSTPESELSARLSAEHRHRSYSALANVIRTRRRENGFTQESFATAAGIDRGLAYCVENARRAVTLFKIRGMLLSLGMNWRDFGNDMQSHDPLPSLDLVARRKLAARGVRP
jgi:transcriptional regulator with XRE-family HTH domain